MLTCLLRRCLKSMTLLIAVTAIQPNLHGEDRPNILFIMSDDHAAHAIGAY